MSSEPLPPRIDRCQAAKHLYGMRNDYPLKGKTETISLAIEADVAFKLKKMAEHTKYTEAELLNTALKRFIATHSDFLPASAGGSKTGN